MSAPVSTKRIASAIVLLTGHSASAAEGPHPGRLVYEAHCAACHDNPEQSKARTFETLQRMIPDMIRYALTDGRMQAQGAAMSETELEDLMDYFKGCLLYTSDAADEYIPV